MPDAPRLLCAIATAALLVAPAVARAKGLELEDLARPSTIGLDTRR